LKAPKSFRVGWNEKKDLLEFFELRPSMGQSFIPYFEDRGKTKKRRGWASTRKREGLDGRNYEGFSKEA
jgi:hypothetical protein